MNELIEWLNLNIEGNCLLEIGGFRDNNAVISKISFNYVEMSHIEKRYQKVTTAVSRGIQFDNVICDLKLLKQLNLEKVKGYFHEQTSIYLISTFNKKETTIKVVKLLKGIRDLRIHEVVVFEDAIVFIGSYCNDSKDKFPKLELEERNNELLERIRSERETLLKYREAVIAFKELEAKYENLKKKYDLLSNAKLAKLTLKYWKYKKRIPDGF